MRHGSISCSCGQQFYFETARAKISCIACNKEHDVSTYPEKIEQLEKLAEEENE